MDPVRWVLLIVGAATIVVYVTWWYGTREEPVPGRRWAAVLRASALILVWLLFLDPRVAAVEAGGEGRTAVLLDASLSMSRPRAPGSGSLWLSARDSAGAVAQRVWLFGGPEPYAVPADSLPEAPMELESRLIPAVRAVVGSAERALIYSDGRIADAMAAREEARRRGLGLQLRRLEAEYAEYGLATVEAPAWAQGGDTIEVELQVLARGVRRDSVELDVVDERGRVVARRRLPTPASGRFVRARLRVAVGGEGGFQRYVARLAPEAPDLETRDNMRAFYVRISETPAGPVLVSLRPDWEPSFLLPLLDRLTDAPSAAYLWLADSLVELERYRPVARSVVQRGVEGAPLLVLHGYGAGAPQWARDLARRAERLLVLPAGTRIFDLPGWEVEVGAPAPGEWYAAPETPASPLALDLSAVSVADLPPLLSVRPVESELSWAPLLVRRARRGEPQAAVVAGRSGSRRWAVAAGEGYWRWAFRPGPGRQLYRALWTGVAGWLVEGRGRSGAGPEPARRVVERGEPLIWDVPAGVDSLAVVLWDEGGAEAANAAAATGESLALGAPPGLYRYRARAYRQGSVVASSDGPAEVEEFSSELLPTVGVESQHLAVDAAGGDGALARSRGLASLWWPYVVLVALFCSEWAVRRFSGLR